jgi:hypothetical protein
MFPGVYRRFCCDNGSGCYSFRCCFFALLVCYGINRCCRSCCRCLP